MFRPCTGILARLKDTLAIFAALKDVNMKALCWHGRDNVRIDNVDDPTIQDPRDAIIRVTSTAICGSDLHMYDGYIPTMKSGDVLGHEFMGEVMELGSAVTNLKIGDRVVVPFTIACGDCFFCRKELWSLCDRSNPNAKMAAAVWGYSPSALFGYSHMLGGFAGGQAEYVRVPYADVGPFKVPDGIEDDRALFLSDIFPTGYMAAENAEIEPGETVAVWGCGPVGQFAIRSAYMLGAERVIAIDRVPERLTMAASDGRTEVLNYEDQRDVIDHLKEETHGRGPDRCIDAVGSEAHGTGPWYVFDRIEQAVRLESDRPYALRQAIQACRKGGTVSVPGVYGGLIDKVPMGSIVNKGLTVKSGQTHVHRYFRPLMRRIEEGEIDPSFVITHRVGLDELPAMYRTFRDKQDGCIKVVGKPSLT
jgi:threonine dehydrogenase-like Zn-dependent dehydrogenase